MKLISETTQEDKIVISISALLNDLEVDIECFESSEALATVFWNVHDFLPKESKLSNLSEQERMQFFHLMEEEIRSAMIIAGYEAIEEEIRKYIS